MFLNYYSRRGMAAVHTFASKQKERDRQKNPCEFEISLFFQGSLRLAEAT